MFKVQVRTADASMMPTATILQELTEFESSLNNNYTWFEFTFDSLDGLDPNVGYCITVEKLSGNGNVAVMEYEKEIPDTPNTQLLEDNGSGWHNYQAVDGSQKPTNSECRFRLYGTTTTAP